MFIDKIHRRMELLKIYDPGYFDVGYLRNSFGTEPAYRTSSGQGILYVKISGPDHRDRNREHNEIKVSRPVIVLVAGMGGSDWIAVTVTMQIVTKLVTSYELGKLSGFDWWIIPVLNPDGYINSQELRNYKANVNPSGGCWGVNLDRNFLPQRDSCIHGRDWYAVQSAIFLATELISNRDRTSGEDFDWWIVPVLNPDGYELSGMDAKVMFLRRNNNPLKFFFSIPLLKHFSDSQWRNWKKNLHGAHSVDSPECAGLDLDLGFEYQWLDCAANPCDLNYPGEVPFLAPEAQGLRDTLEAFSDHVDTFIALKEEKQMLVYPFSDTSQRPRNVEKFEKISKKAVKAFGKYVEGVYEHGQSSCLLNVSAGFIEDWAKVHLGVEKSFAFYLGPADKDRRDLRSQHLESHFYEVYSDRDKEEECKRLVLGHPP
ncbi:putative carboxypeptidase suro-1 [Venturia canescens]|uniref:putative carboxypeptidase suro-1 n=1 Tax=Venturia canescens TaxID=32260 RepID=UPI001C9C2CAA|nr:putative carboxypeptidase suro-1 [Venturia canescens]